MEATGWTLDESGRVELITLATSERPIATCAPNRVLGITQSAEAKEGGAVEKEQGKQRKM